MIARHALFSYGSSMSACEHITHTGATYYAIEYHRVSVVVIVVLVFVPNFELANFIKRLLWITTFILVCCM